MSEHIERMVVAILLFAGNIAMAAFMSKLLSTEDSPVEFSTVLVALTLFHVLHNGLPEVKK
jgi:hypothetical protein